ncbi:orotate phosphoribosyltransferase, partial [Francisella tularensis]|nr:orotate phosphoribosyltransferase [Francisella tularensis]
MFIDFALKYQVLIFGEFTLTSGSLRPYFFDACQFNTGIHLDTLAAYYALHIIKS